ncbi:Gamma-aminobutyric acid type B receptor subunit 2, partial [Geodia barretti]
PVQTVEEFDAEYYNLLKTDSNEAINLRGYINDSQDPFVYSYHCHEGMLTLAYALNKTIADLAENETLNREAAEESGLPEGETFTMANFTYANSGIVTRMFEHLQNTSFQGITGNEVKFDADGIRDIETVAILQYQRDSNGSLNRIEVATVKGTNSTFYSTSDLVLPYGIPYDGVPFKDVVTVSVALTVVYVILATAGLVFAVACVLFTLVFRKKKLIRLSSPNLNYLIGLGAIVLYLNVIVLVIPTTNPEFAAVLCNFNPWLTSLGYSLCYGTILIKMIRVWLIFNKPLGLKATFLQDYAMVLFVLSLVVIDVVILGVYTLTEMVKGDLGVKLTPNREMPEEIIGPTAEIHENFLYECESKGRVVLYAVLFGYKGLLTVIALLLAFHTRKVKVKGLDDSKYIAASIYVTSIVLAVIIVSTYTLNDYVNAYPAVVGVGFLFGTTVILALVFTPRMVELYKDPEGDKIMIGMSSTLNRGSENEVIELRRRISELEKNLKQRVSAELPPSLST